MLNESLVADVLALAHERGADFAELYVERWKRRQLRVLNNEVKEATSGLEYGAGLRLFYGDEVAYAYTNDLTRTGHAARSYRSVLTTFPSNLYVKPGPGITMRRGVVVAEVMGVHAGTNSISGDFSVQALGLWVEDGEVAYAVENFAVAGNFLTLLMNIAAIDPTLKWDLAGRMAVGTPTVEVADLSFAGV